MNKALYDFIVDKKHHQFRRQAPELQGLTEEFAAQKLDPKERMTRRFERMAFLEQPVILDGEQICFLRTVTNLPDCFTEIGRAHV